MDPGAAWRASRICTCSAKHDLTREAPWDAEWNDRLPRGWLVMHMYIAMYYARPPRNVVPCAELLVLSAAAQLPRVKTSHKQHRTIQRVLFMCGVVIQALHQATSERERAALNCIEDWLQRKRLLVECVWCGVLFEAFPTKPATWTCISAVHGRYLMPQSSLNRGPATSEALA